MVPGTRNAMEMGCEGAGTIACHSHHQHYKLYIALFSISSPKNRAQTHLSLSAPITQSVPLTFSEGCGRELRAVNMPTLRCEEEN